MLLKSTPPASARKTVAGLYKIYPDVFFASANAAIATVSRMEGLIVGIDERLVFSVVSLRQVAAGAANTKLGFAIYDLSTAPAYSAVGGTKIFDSGILVATGTGTVSSPSGSYSINPGRYLLAYTTDSAATFTSMLVGANPVISANFYQSSANITTPGQMPNTVPAGIMNAGSCPFFRFATT